MNLFKNIAITNDGSSTFFLPDWNEFYHSKHGAIQESNYVFIKNGFELYLNKNKTKSVTILEMGFGTGLNCLLSYQHALQIGATVNYIALEAYPVTLAEVKQLNFIRSLKSPILELPFERLHTCPWNETCVINPTFNLTKLKQRFEDFADPFMCDIIYFDVFGKRVQPELWTAVIFKKMYNSLNFGGILVTYASNSNAIKAMIEAGFLVEKIKGPPGKREMIRAFKNLYNHEF